MNLDALSHCDNRLFQFRRGHYALYDHFKQGKKEMIDKYVISMLVALGIISTGYWVIFIAYKVLHYTIKPGHSTLEQELDRLNGNEN